MFKTMAEVRKANKAIGHYYFSEGTMAFFNSKIESELNKDNQCFITSERMDIDSPKKYTIRKVNEDGSISNFSEFRQYETLEHAKLCLKVL